VSHEYRGFSSDPEHESESMNSTKNALNGRTAKLRVEISYRSVRSSSWRTCRPRSCA